MSKKNVGDTFVSTGIEVEKDGRGDNDGEVEVHKMRGYNEEKQQSLRYQVVIWLLMILVQWST